MSQTDAMIARLESELEERNSFVDGLVGNAQEAGRDLDAKEMELIGNARKRIGALNEQLDPLRETSRITIESRNRARQINDEMQIARQNGRTPGGVEYRSAGAYVADLYLARMGDDGAMSRQEVFHRAAAHQTTADNPGLLPESIVGPLVNFVDTSPADRRCARPPGPRQSGRGRTPGSPSTPRSASSQRRRPSSPAAR